MLPKIAELFSVSTDYLLTGEEQEQKPISKLEACAKYNNINVYYELKNNNQLFSVWDENGKELMDYVLKYESSIIFNKLIEEKNYRNWMERIRDRALKDKDILYLAIISNSESLLKKNGRTLKIYPNKSNEEYADFLIHVLFTDERVKPETFKFILGLDEEELNRLFFSKFVKEAIAQENVDTASQLIFKGIQNNSDAIRAYDEIRRTDPTWLSSHINLETVKNRQGRIVATFVTVEKETFDAAIDKKYFEILNGLNEINQLCPKKGTYVLTAKEIEIAIIEKSEGLSKKEKNKKLVMAGGLLDVDKLISLNDYALYEEMIDLPAYLEEILLGLIQNGKFKELLSEALEQKDKYPWLADAVLSFDSKKIMEINLRQSRSTQIKPQEYWTERKKQAVDFKKIINHKDIRFFKIACSNDPKNLDWALEHIDPSRFDIIRLLLDNGAKLHKRYSEDDGWGYMQSHDEVDQIGTELLKKKINDILGGTEK